MRNIVCSFLGFSVAAVIVAGCTTGALRGGAGAASESGPAGSGVECGVYGVMYSVEPIGTSFSIDEGNRLFFITASHVVRGLDERKLTLSSSCSSEEVLITDVLHIPSTDLAVLIANPVRRFAGLRLANEKAPWGSPILLPGYPNVSKGSVRFAKKLIPAEGRLVSLADEQILFTANIVYKGSSGGPILDSDGRVLGMITNRIIIDGTYSGLSYGTSFNAIRAAIKSLPARVN